MYVTEDEKTQKKGHVYVFFGVGVSSKEPFDRECVWKMSRVMNALPVRVEAIHVCSDSMFVAAITSMVKFSLSPFNSLRIRSHYGRSLKACSYKTPLRCSHILQFLPRGRITRRMFSQTQSVRDNGRVWSAIRK